MKNMISLLRQKVIESGTVTIGVDEFNQLQAEWIKRSIPDEMLKAQQVIGIEKAVTEFANKSHLHNTFEVTPNQLYDFCDEIYGGDSQHVRAIPHSS